MLHRVGAIRLLGGRQGWLQRGVDLPASATTEQLLALLDASAPLTGMENLAGACAARIINELSDAHPARHGGEHTDGHLGQASLGLLPGLPLHRLSAPAKDLLLRAALTVIADARGRSRLRFVTAAAAAAPQGQAQAPLLGQLGRGDVWLMAATAGRCGSYCWAAGTHDAADLEDGPPANLVSPVFRWGRGCCLPRTGPAWASRQGCQDAVCPSPSAAALPAPTRTLLPSNPVLAASPATAGACAWWG